LIFHTDRTVNRSRGFIPGKAVWRDDEFGKIPDHLPGTVIVGGTACCASDAKRASGQWLLSHDLRRPVKSTGISAVQSKLKKTNS